MATLQQRINVAFVEAFGRNATAGELSYYGNKGDAGYELLVSNLRKDPNAGGNFKVWRDQQASQKQADIDAAANAAKKKEDDRIAAEAKAAADAATKAKQLADTDAALAANAKSKQLSGINALYKKYFGRDATQGELDHYEGKSLDILKNNLIADPKVARAYDAFRKYRGREPNADEMNTYLNATPDRLYSDLINSQANILGQGTATGR